MDERKSRNKINQGTKLRGTEERDHQTINLINGKRCTPRGADIKKACFNSLKIVECFLQVVIFTKRKHFILKYKID